MSGNFNTEQFRKDLLSRNIYSVDNQYPIEGTTAQKIANSIDSLIDRVSPFKAFDLTNSIFGRLVLRPNTPLAQIGLKMLGLHLTYEVQSGLLRNYTPTINPIGALKGGKLIQFRNDFSITKKNDDKWYTKVLSRSSDITGLYSKYLFNLSTEPKPNGTFRADTDELLRNTSKGQLNILFGYLNMNRPFKTNDKIYRDAAESINFKLEPSGGVFGNSFVSYGGDINDKDVNNPYSLLVVSFNNGKYRVSNVGDNGFVNEYLGSTLTSNDYVDYSSDGRNTWVSGIVDGGGFSENHIILDKNQSYNNVNHGLLRNTINLMVKSDGELVDQTKKVIRHSNTKPSFNGSPLTFDTKNNIENFKRQHTVNDKYDRLAKAIRFEGNKQFSDVYEGAVDSVIFESVIPRVHPTRKDDVIDNKNLMFSIENLAVKVTQDGIIDDGTVIPLSEVGSNGGRQMWFAPYGLDFNETTAARFESTIMMGRSEPMYNYQSTERSGTIKLKLIIDHPPHVRSIKKNKGNDLQHRSYSEFFAFGGDYDKSVEPTPPDDIVPPPTPPPTPPPPPLPTPPSPFSLYYSNDQPKTNNIDTVFDHLYSNAYEVGDDIKPPTPAVDGNTVNTSLNKDVYTEFDNVINLLDPPQGKYTREIDKNAYLTFGLTQYNDNDNGYWGSLFDFYLSDFEAAVKYFKIKINAAATRQHRDQSTQSEYNLRLSERRALAAKNLIIKKLEARFPDRKSLISNIQFDITFEGSTNSNTGAGGSVNTPTAKGERRADISVLQTGKPLYDIEDIVPVEEVKPPTKRKPESEFIYKHRGTTNDENGVDVDNGILSGFSSISGGYYYPAFHSQTPEEFHRRLTFLQQCTRQGNAIRYESSDGTTSTTIRNSVFGRQPICVIRIADFIHSKVIIENITFDYTDMPWDFNPEGFGVQPMMADVTLQVKLMGGQSLKAPIDALQNAISLNYYANSSYSNNGIYKKPYDIAVKQLNYNEDKSKR